MKSLFEQQGGTYTMQGDYRLPNLTGTLRRRMPYRRMGTAPTEIFEATPQNPVLQFAHFRQAAIPPCRYRRTSTSSLFSTSKRIRR